MPVLRCSLLTAERLPEVLALDKLCLGGLWTEAGYQREIDSPNSDLLVLELLGAASVEQAPSPSPAPPLQSTILGLGCVWAILDEAHITTLAIHPDYHRARLGQWLLVQLLVAACRRQLTHATLEVRASNAPALQLYQKFEFKVAGRRKRYYADDEDALVLWCSDLQRDTFSQILQRLSHESEQAILQRGWHLR